MAGFNQKILDPLTKEANGKLEQALGAEDITARTDGLITARDESEAKFKTAYRNEALKTAGAGATGLLGLAATYLGISTATSLIALLAGTTGFAIPLAIIGAVVAGASGVSAYKTAGNMDKLKNAWNAFSKKADAEVKNLVQAHPEETAKSSKLSAYLKRVFNSSASEAKPAAAAPAPVTAPKAGMTP